jgi:hypothetical protein
MLRIPHCIENWLKDGSKVVSLIHQSSFTPQKHFLALISVRGSINPRAIVWLEGLDK